MKHVWYIATGSDATGVILNVPDQDGDEYDELTDEIELIDDTSGTAGTTSETVDFQIILLLVLGIIIGILLIGDRRLG